MTAAGLIAELATDRVIVFGSLPPDGRDLDLLVRSPEAAAIAAGLAMNGFERRGRVWARFAECSADAVELVPAGDWRLPAEELGAIFAEAEAIDAAGRLCRPAPHHVLLILARRAMREGPRLREKRRDRIVAELARDPGAFEHARQRARAWGADAALTALESGYRSGTPISAATRRDAVRAELRDWQRPVKAWLNSWRAVLRRPRRGHVIAFSGLDGSGKSTQVRALAETLDRLGEDVAVAWTSVAFHPPWLGRLARAIKRSLTRLARPGGSSPQAATAPGAPHGGDDPGQVLRRRSKTLTFAWSLVVTILLASEVVRRVWPALLRGKIVVCDRHLLDAWAHLLYQYGDDGGYRPQLAILRAVFPGPRLAYFLDVSPEAASRRKQDYDVAQNSRRAIIYRRQARELGVCVLDGERPVAELCAEIARETWTTLAGR